jgi:hypothetical protein
MDRKALEERIAGLRSRGEVKAFVRQVADDPELEKALRALADARGLVVEEPVDARAIVRQLRDREGEARRRKNPWRLDGGFVCVSCAARSERWRASAICLFCRGLRRRRPAIKASCGGVLVPVASRSRARRRRDHLPPRGAVRSEELRARRRSPAGRPRHERAPELDLPYGEARDS